MIGFVIGTLCLFGLIKVIRRSYGYGYGGPLGYGGGCGHRGFGGGQGFGGWHDHHDGGYRDHWEDRGEGWQGGRGFRAPWSRGGGGPWSGKRFFLRRLFERLDTSPGQEKVIVAALDDLQNAARGIKDEMRGARSEFATAMRGASFDEVSLGGATARVEHGIDSMRKAGIDAFAKIHEALDDRQRGILADWIERGPRPFGY